MDQKQKRQLANELMRYLESYIKEYINAGFREFGEKVVEEIEDMLDRIESEMRKSFQVEREIFSSDVKIRMLEETLSAKNIGGVFDEQTPIPHWKKL